MNDILERNFYKRFLGYIPFLRVYYFLCSGNFSIHRYIHISETSICFIVASFSAQISDPYDYTGRTKRIWRSRRLMSVMSYFPLPFNDFCVTYKSLDVNRRQLIYFPRRHSASASSISILEIIINMLVI